MSKIIDITDYLDITSNIDNCLDQVCKLEDINSYAISIISKKKHRNKTWHHYSILDGRKLTLLYFSNSNMKNLCDVLILDKQGNYDKFYTMEYPSMEIFHKEILGY